MRTLLALLLLACFVVRGQVTNGILVDIATFGGTPKADWCVAIRPVDVRASGGYVIASYGLAQFTVAKGTTIFRNLLPGRYACTLGGGMFDQFRCDFIVPETNGFWNITELIVPKVRADMETRKPVVRPKRPEFPWGMWLIVGLLIALLLLACLWCLVFALRMQATLRRLKRQVESLEEALDRVLNPKE